jgi:hypothetical protein
LSTADPAMPRCRSVTASTASLVSTMSSGSAANSPSGLAHAFENNHHPLLLGGEFSDRGGIVQSEHRQARTAVLHGAAPAEILDLLGRTRSTRETCSMGTAHNSPGAFWKSKQRMALAIGRIGGFLTNRAFGRARGERRTRRQTRHIQNHGHPAVAQNGSAGVIRNGFQMPAQGFTTISTVSCSSSTTSPYSKAPVSTSTTLRARLPPAGRGTPSASAR